MNHRSFSLNNFQAMDHRHIKIWRKKVYISGEKNPILKITYAILLFYCIRR